MRLTVYLSDGGTLDVAHFQAETVLDMLDALRGGDFLQFEMDDDTVIVNRNHIVRVDIEGIS